MTDWTQVRGTQPEKPLEVDTCSSTSTVYLRKNIEQIEADTAEVERKIAEYDARFATATEYNAEDYKEYDELKRRYDHLMHEWEKASYEVEITEQQ